MSGTSASGSGEVSGNTFHGPVAFQTGGEANTLTVHHHHAPAGPPAPLDAAADELAQAVRKQWAQEAGLRRLLEPAPLPVRWRTARRRPAGRIAAATADGTRTRFTPLPGLPATTREDLLTGGGLPELHRVYGGLASGRLLLVGRPAAGKSAAAVLLLLDALRYRDAVPAPYRAQVPVPVLLSLNGWDPRAPREPAAEWAAGRIAREYTLFHGRGGRERARQLIETGRIALFLDGFDEVGGGKLRGAMLKALELAPCRLVLVSRTEEANNTGKARLGGAAALEIEPVRPADAAAYLLNPLPEPAPPAWQLLTDRLLADPDSAVAAVLAGPLAITLLHDAYAADDPVDELLDARFRDADSIEDHLLDHAVAAAYTARPGQPRRRPRYSPETAERALRHIAVRLTREGTRDLRWWHVPGWTARRPRALAMGALVALVCGVPSTALLWTLTHSAVIWLVAPPSVLLGAWAAGDKFAELSVPQPLPSAGWRDIFSPGAIASGLVEWLVTGTLASLSAHLLPGPTLPAWLCFLTTLPLGFTGVLVTGRGHEIVAGAPFLSIGAGRWYDEVRTLYNRPAVADSRSIGPRDVWRHHLGLRLILGLLTGVAVALLTAPLVAWWLGPSPGVLSAVSAALWCAAMAGPVGNLAVATAFAAVQLSWQEGTPVRLMSFLEDARRRNLLRATGPVYQFRHARLQERLALGTPRERE